MVFDVYMCFYDWQLLISLFGINKIHLIFHQS